MLEVWLDDDKDDDDAGIIWKQKKMTVSFLIMWNERKFLIDPKTVCVIHIQMNVFTLSLALWAECKVNL